MAGDRSCAHHSSGEGTKPPPSVTGTAWSGLCFAAWQNSRVHPNGAAAPKPLFYSYIFGGGSYRSEAGAMQDRGYLSLSVQRV